MQVKPIDQAPHDGSLQLVAYELTGYGPYYPCRFRYGLWFVAGAPDNMTVEARRWLDLTPKPA